MTTAYSNLLGLALPVTGELSGTWGDTVNDYITKYLDDAIANAQVISGSQTAVTLSKTTGTALVSAGSGSTGSAQYALIRCTGNPASTLTITVSYASLTNSQFSKTYLIFNSTSTNQSVVVQATTSSGTSTGVTIAAGERALIAWNGTDFVKIATQSGTGEFVTVDTTNLEVTNIKAKDGTAAATIADSTGAITVSTLLNVDNLRLDGNTLSSTDSNGNVVLAPNGTGDVQLDADTVRVGDSAAAVTLTSNGAGALTVTTGGAADLILNTNSGTNSGSITIGNGTNGNITVATNGTGDFYVDADTVRIGDSNANATITTNGTGDLILNTNAGTNSGSITIEDGVNGNIIIAPNGTGQVQITNASLDLTTIEVTNIKAKDGTAAMSIADSTGVVSITANPVLSGGTANGVLYLNASKVATSGSALTFDTARLSFIKASNGRAWSADGDDLFAIENSTSANADFRTSTTGASYLMFSDTDARARGYVAYLHNSDSMPFAVAGSEAMRLVTGGKLNIGGNFTSTNNTLQVTGNAAIGYTTAAPTTGLIVAGDSGIGTSSPSTYGRLAVVKGAGTDGGSDAPTLFVGTPNYGTNILLGTIQIGSTAGSDAFIGYGARIASYASGGVNVTDLRLYNSNVERAQINSSGTLILRQSSNAANTSVSFNTTVQNALTLDSDGDLGIGVATPAYRLSVQGSAELLADLYSTSAGFNTVLQFRNDNSANGRLGYYNGNFRWSVDNGVTQNMSLTSSGRLGIGETNPDGMVIVKNTLSSGVLARFIQNNASFNSDVYINHTSSANDFLISRRSTGEAWLYQSGAEPIVFYTSGQPRARIMSSGEFLIGTSSNGFNGQGLPLVVGSGSGSTGMTIYSGTAGYGTIQFADAVSTGADSYRGVISYKHGDEFMYFSTNAVERMRIDSSGTLILRQSSNAANTSVSFNTTVQNALTLDSSGNLGLGVTPSAWTNNYKVLETQSGWLGGNDPNTIFFGQNNFVSSGNFVYKTTAAATQYRQAAGQHQWFNAASGTQNTAISFTQAMTLDASGRLGIGETNPTELLVVKNASGAANFKLVDGGTAANTVWIGNRPFGATTAGIYTDGASNLAFGTNSAERARITSGGLVQVSSGGSVQIGGTAARATTAGTNRLDIFNGTAPVGTLSNGISIYSSSGEAYVMDAAGNATLFSPHDAETNEWIFKSKHTPTGKTLKIDVEKLLRFINDHFGLDAVHEFIEE